MLFRLPLPSLMDVRIYIYVYKQSIPMFLGRGLQRLMDTRQETAHIFLGFFRNWMRILPLHLSFHREQPSISGLKVPREFKVALFRGVARRRWLRARPARRLRGCARLRNFLMTMGTATPNLLRGPVISLSPNYIRASSEPIQVFVPELFTADEAGGRRRGWPFSIRPVSAGVREELVCAGERFVIASAQPAHSQMGDHRPGN